MENCETASDRSAGEKATLRAGLGRVGGERRFVVRNVGSIPAYDVAFKVEPESGRNSPIVSSEYDQKFPVDELPPGHEETLLAVITSGTGIEFRGALSWRNPDGSRETKELAFSI